MYATDVESMRLTSELTTDRGIDISSSNYNDEDLKNKATDIEMRDAVIFDKLEASEDIQVEIVLSIQILQMYDSLFSTMI